MVIDSVDDKFDEALEMVIRTHSASPSMLQKELNINFGRSINILKQLEMIGVVSKAKKGKRSEVLIRHLDEIKWR